MKIFLGTDVCEIERIHSLYNRFGDKFLKKIYTQDEIQYCLSNVKLKAERLSARFAAKEAASKALGVGMNGLGWQNGVNWQDIELIRHENGNLSLKLYYKADKIAQNLGIASWAVSVSHNRTTAFSTVIGHC